MASRFFIEVQSEPIRGRPRVRILDEDQDESTGWVKTYAAVRGQAKETVLAIAFLESPEVNRYLTTAAEVAYAVYLNEESFDIHAFIKSAVSLRDAATLKRELEENFSTPGASRFPRL